MIVQAKLNGTEAVVSHLRKSNLPHLEDWMLDPEFEWAIQYDLADLQAQGFDYPDYLDKTQGFCLLRSRGSTLLAPLEFASAIGTYFRSFDGRLHAVTYDWDGPGKSKTIKSDDELQQIIDGCEIDHLRLWRSRGNGLHGVSVLSHPIDGIADKQASIGVADRAIALLPDDMRKHLDKHGQILYLWSKQRSKCAFEVVKEAVDLLDPDTLPPAPETVEKHDRKRIRDLSIDDMLAELPDHFSPRIKTNNPERFAGGRHIEITTSHIDHLGDSCILYVSQHTGQWKITTHGSAKSNYSMGDFLAAFLPHITPDPKFQVLDELRLAKHVLGKRPHLRSYEGDWYEWDQTWKAIDADTLRHQIYTIIKDHLIAITPDLPPVGKRDPKPARVPTLDASKLSMVLTAMRSLVTLHHTGWVDGRGGQWLSFHNCILSLDAWIERGERIQHVPTPNFFDPNPLPYDCEYTDADPKLLLKLLQEQMTDAEVKALQEFAGYCFTDDTRIQKGLFVLGPPRSGKGTIERIIRNRVGENNCVSKKLDELGNTHALANLPGKRFFAISDCRPEKRDQVQSGVQTLLYVIGGDAVDINRKHLDPYCYKPVAKVLVACNQVPPMGDATDALLNRFVFIETTVSYAGKEDPTLFDQIMEESNEITWWMLRGLRRLWKQKGKYTTVVNDVAQRFLMLNSPVATFISECCTIDSTTVLDKKTLYESYRDWCEMHALKPVDDNVFYSQLYARFRNQIGPTRVKDGDKRVNKVKGVKIND